MNKKETFTNIQMYFTYGVRATGLDCQYPPIVKQVPFHLVAVEGTKLKQMPSNSTSTAQTMTLHVKYGSFRPRM